MRSSNPDDVTHADGVSGLVLPQVWKMKLECIQYSDHQMRTIRYPVSSDSGTVDTYGETIELSCVSWHGLGNIEGSKKWDEASTKIHSDSEPE